MFKVYSKMHGLAYLFTTLAHLIVSLKHETETNEIQMEVDTFKLEEGEDSISNKWQLLLIAQKIWSSISKSATKAPLTLRYLTYFIHSEVSLKYPQYSFRSIGAFWFLRFFCPALVAPHAYGLIPEPPSNELQRELILLSKIMQNLANEVGNYINIFFFE